MELIRHVVVLDASDIGAESEFWAAMLDGQVVADDSFHCVIDSDGNWLLGVQHAPDHQPPEWPHGRAQQAHLDLHVIDAAASTARAIELGATPLRTDDDLEGREGFHVFADPAGHPFCIGWGHPDHDDLRRFLATRGTTSDVE